jgi:hypothetical protein
LPYISSEAEALHGKLRKMNLLNSYGSCGVTIKPEQWCKKQQMEESLTKMGTHLDILKIDAHKLRQAIIQYVFHLHEQRHALDYESCPRKKKL